MAVMAGGTLRAQSPIYNAARVYDTVSDADTFYYFTMPMPKPCIEQKQYRTFWGTWLLQEYVASDTLTVYGVAVTFRDRFNDVVYDNNVNYQAVLMTCLGPSVGITLSNAYTMQLIDSVTINHSHPRFSWFLYENDCSDKQAWTEPCYEFYFDTPQQINRITDTFYVGRHWIPGNMFRPDEYAGLYSNSLPSYLLWGPEDNFEGVAPFNMFGRVTDSRDAKLWGWAFPIIGFRCGPMRQYWLDAYTGDRAIVRWRSVEEGTMYNVRLVGEDGSDTTYVTADTSIVFSQLSDSVRYSVTMRKQCHYATSNYDTTVYGEWAPGISFGTTINPDDTTGHGGGGGGGGDTIHRGDEGIELSVAEDFSLRPNPATESVQMMFPATALGGRLSLCDLEGRELRVRTVSATAMELDLRGLSTGVYLVKLATANGTVVQRLLVE